MGRSILKQWISSVLILAILLMLFPTSVLASNLKNKETPELLTLSVKTASGEEISLLDKDTISVDLGGSYSFSAMFSCTEQIDRVYITSTKGSAVRLLEAKWDGEAFTTSGYFDGDNEYIPGKIGVEYTTKTQEVNISDEVDWVAMKDAVGNEITVSDISGSGESKQATVDLSELLKAEGLEALEFTVDVFDEKTDGNLADWLGVYKDLDQLTKYFLDDKSGQYYLYLDYSNASTYAMILRDVSKSTYVKILLEEAGDHSGTIEELAHRLEDINTVSSLLYESLTIPKSADELHNQVAVRPDLSGPEKEELNKRIDAYERDRLLFALCVTALPAVVVASGGTMAGVALGFNALLKILDASSDFFWDYRVGMMTGCEPIETDFTSDAHGTPLTRELYESMGHRITKSGTYYLVDDMGIYVDVANVTICTHGYNCTIEIRNGGSLNLFDCTYEEDMDGNMVSLSEETHITNAGGLINIQGGRVFLETSQMGRCIVNRGTIDKIITEGGGSIEILGGTVVNGVDNNNGSLLVSDGRVGKIYNKSGIVTITGGTITQVRNNNDGTLNISGGAVIDDGIENYGTLYIRGGDFRGERIGNYGTAEIFDGNFACPINNSSFSTLAILNIHDGVFQTTYRYNVSNTGGRLTIEGGNFQAINGGNDAFHYNVETWSDGNNISETTIYDGVFYSESGSCIENNSIASDDASRTSHTTIKGGSFSSSEGSCVYNTGIMTISGGSFTSRGSSAYTSVGCIANHKNQVGGYTFNGMLTITGGNFYSINDICIINDADMTISDGSFVSDQDPGIFCVANSGEMLIQGGTFTCQGSASSCIESQGSLGLTISGGKFLAPNGPTVVQAESCTILIGENSSIEMIGDQTGFFWKILDGDIFRFATAEGYTEGIAYYDSPDGKGVFMTAAEFAAMDLPSGRYLCLEAESSASTEKTVVNITGVAATTDLTYDGTAQRGYTGTPTSLYTGEYEVTYTGIGNTVYGPSNVPPANSGTYMVTISVPDFDKKYAGSITLDFVIERANITIIANDMSIYTGDNEPHYTYTIMGLANGDVLLTEPTLTSDININVAGTYTIVPSGAIVPNNDNYNESINYVNGVLTVSKKNSSSGSGNSGGSSSNNAIYTIKMNNTHNGSVSVNPTRAKRGEIVTITVKPDNGYKMGNISVTDASGNIIEVDCVSATQYTFEMPYNRVNIEVVFVKAENEQNLDELRFTDVYESDYYHDAVLWAVANGVTTGTSATTFAPNETVSRAQMITFLWRAAGSPVPTGDATLFTDIPSNAYYADAVLWAIEHGITSGVSTTTFNPDATCTRAQIITFLYRFAGSPATSSSNVFVDVSMNSYYADAVEWALSMGVTSGSSDTTFSPDASCTRAQGITFLYRYMI